MLSFNPVLISVTMLINGGRTPFTVLFTHVINNGEHGDDDMRLLEDFVNSLHLAKHISDGIERFHHLCSIFYKIAESYIAAKNQEAVMLEFDNYLSTLGFVPNAAIGDNTLLAPDNANVGDGATANFQNWHSGNVSLYGLVQEDLSDLGNWDNGSNQVFA